MCWTLRSSAGRGGNKKDIDVCVRGWDGMDARASELKRSFGRWTQPKASLSLLSVIHTLSLPLSMSDPTTIANEFVKFYYQTFDGGRSNLAAVYVRRVGRAGVRAGVRACEVRGWL